MTLQNMLNPEEFYAQLIKCKSSTVQRAAMAVKFMEPIQDEAKKRQRAAGGDKRSVAAQAGAVPHKPSGIDHHGSKSVVQAAKTVGAGQKATAALKRIRDNNPAVFERAVNGEFKTVQEALYAAGLK